MILCWLGVSVGNAGGVFVDVAQAQALIDGGATVLDARGAKAWKKGHVPGSWPVDWLAHRDGTLRTGVLTTDVDGLAQTLRVAGVRDDEPVILVGAGRDGWGEEGRWFWTLEYLGHGQVVVLDGGWPAWQGSGGPSTRDATPPAAGDFSPRVSAERRASIDQVAAAARSGEAVIWDTREDREYAGATPYGESRGGHIPGAAGLWYGDLLSADGTLLPESELRALLAAHGIRPDRAVITACTGGVRSGFAYAVLRALGYPTVANYDGSMWQWSADPSRPLTTARPQPPVTEAPAQ